MSRIFVSHSSWNNDKAIEVRDWLAKNGWDDVFLDLDPERGIAAGQRWKEALQKAAWRCELVLALVSKEWLASSWCKCPSSADLRQFAGFWKGGCGSSVVEIMRPAVDAANDDLRWSGV
jgi:hypothetical protein